jgi:GrpB-like predicted nucleotidyltransferase (UPF0157 family)
MSMVAIVPYDARWPGEFDRIAAELRTALAGHALRVDHIGSTSVPNLGAKDVIDIQVTVKEFASATSAMPFSSVTSCGPRPRSRQPMPRSRAGSPQRSQIRGIMRRSRIRRSI